MRLLAQRIASLAATGMLAEANTYLGDPHLGLFASSQL